MPIEIFFAKEEMVCFRIFTESLKSNLSSFINLTLKIFNVAQTKGIH